jgi:DNA-binding PadR family transcriptional regulator
MAKGKFLGEFEQVVLLAVARRGDDAYGARIRQEVEDRTGRGVAVGAIYSTLDRLVAKRYLSFRDGETSPDRGGRPKRYFRLQPSGVTALETARRILDRMWEGVRLPGSASR